MAPKILVDRDLCGGHAVCVDEAPDVFALDDDDKVVVRLPEPPADRLDAVRAACRYCPTKAIRLVEG
jgi:ferredoxin